MLESSPKVVIIGWLLTQATKAWATLDAGGRCGLLVIALAFAIL